MPNHSVRSRSPPLGRPPRRSVVARPAADRTDPAELRARTGRPEPPERVVRVAIRAYTSSSRYFQSSRNHVSHHRRQCRQATPHRTASHGRWADTVCHRSSCPDRTSARQAARQEIRQAALLRARISRRHTRHTGQPVGAVGGVVRVGRIGVAGQVLQDLDRVQVEPDVKIEEPVMGRVRGRLGQRVRQQVVQRLRKRVARLHQLRENRLQIPEYGDRVVPAGFDHPGADLAQLLQRAEHVDQLVALVGEHLQTRTHGIEGLRDRAPFLGQSCREPIQGVDRLDDVLLLVVQATDERVQLVQRVLDPGLATLQRVADLLADGLQVGQTAAVEQQRHGSQHFLDLDTSLGTRDRDDVAVAELALRLLLLRRLEGYELLAQQAGLAQRGERVVRQLHPLLDAQLHPGGPTVQPDPLHAADRHVVDLDRCFGDQVEYVGELHRDRVVVASRSTAGEWDRRRDLFAAAGQREHDHHGRGGRADNGTRVRPARHGGPHRDRTPQPTSDSRHHHEPPKMPPNDGSIPSISPLGGCGAPLSLFDPLSPPGAGRESPNNFASSGFSVAPASWSRFARSKHCCGISLTGSACTISEQTYAAASYGPIRFGRLSTVPDLALYAREASSAPTGAMSTTSIRAFRWRTRAADTSVRASTSSSSSFRLSLTNLVTWPSADATFFSAADSSCRSSASCSDTSASWPLNRRTSLSLSASTSEKACRLSIVPNRSCRPADTVCSAATRSFSV